MKYKVKIMWEEVIEHHEDVEVEADLDPEYELEDVLWDAVNDIDSVPPDFQIVGWEEVKEENE